MVTSIKGNDTSTFGGQVVTPAPVFRAGLSASQAITTSSYTKLMLNNVDFDETSAYDNTTNYRFQPTVAGYYLAICGVLMQQLNDGDVMYASLAKNGTEDTRGTRVVQGTNGNDHLSRASNIIYLNGTTDYLEFYVWHNYGSDRNAYGASTQFGYTHGSAALVRAV